MNPFAKKIDRRSFLTKTATGITVASALPFVDDLARAQRAEDEEHFFVFVELVGGAHCMISTDARDPATLPLTDPSMCWPLEITDQPPLVTELEAWRTSSNQKLEMLGAPFIIQPYIGDMASSYKVGKTNYVVNGNAYSGRYTLGPAGLPLQSVVNDMVVVRGVRMRGSFHPRGEIFSGSSFGRSLPSVLAKLLAADPRYGGRKLMDNVVFENAFVGLQDEQTAIPVIADGQSLSNLVSFLGEDAASRLLFSRARKLTEAMTSGLGGADLRTVFGNYVSSLSEASDLADNLKSLSFDNQDISLDLGRQFKAAATLMQAGLTRVITLGLGMTNGKNNVDGFGMFDTHNGLYHLDASNPSRANSNRHHLNLGKAMQDVADFIRYLKTTNYKNTNKKLYDLTTVIISSDYARPSNIDGFMQDAQAVDGRLAFGTGHNHLNNNYIMFGKGIRGGAWIGENHKILQYADFVDMSTLNNPDVAKVVTSTAVEGESTFKGTNDTGNLRTFMVKDVLKTLMTAAGYENKFTEIYKEEEYAEAQVIAPVLNNRF